MLSVMWHFQANLGQFYGFDQLIYCLYRVSEMREKARRSRECGREGANAGDSREMRETWQVCQRQMNL